MFIQALNEIRTWLLRVVAKISYHLSLPHANSELEFDLVFLLFIVYNVHLNVRGIESFASWQD